ncbi:hypothetical protein ACMD2_02799 [Ananas comosus]|uniref:Uncharacterized protein n=1 Tax=Ananas comosus TaxID=4615 RepID=A0A199V8C5_ANACO|nr:hypothetical protein ACMD2_02799 [Ananas comosus]
MATATTAETVTTTTKTALSKIERAHQMYREGRHEEALGLYTEALAMAKTKAQKIALHSNRAACYLKLHDFKKALKLESSTNKIPAKPNGWEAIPKPKGHSGLDYSRWDKVEDDSSEEEDDDVEEQQPQYRFRVRTVGVRPVKSYLVSEVFSYNHVAVLNKRYDNPLSVSPAMY